MIRDTITILAAALMVIVVAFGFAAAVIYSI